MDITELIKSAPWMKIIAEADTEKELIQLGDLRIKLPTTSKPDERGRWLNRPDVQNLLKKAIEQAQQEVALDIKEYLDILNKSNTSLIDPEALIFHIEEKLEKYLLEKKGD